jgi:hypothetical protein
MPSMNQTEYFNMRARRYENALRGCPSARNNDIGPYKSFLENCPRSVNNVLDAFGGTGFITNSLSKILNADFTIADASTGMLAGASNRIRKIQIAPDFSGLPGKYDLVISHGGLHHAIIEKDNRVREKESNILQKTIITNLANAVQHAGYMIITDIPKYGDNIPRKFFDEYIANNMRLGHLANYLDFKDVGVFLKAQGFDEISNVYIRTPWIFENKSLCGWFFREKFSIGTESRNPGDFLNENLEMFRILEKYLDAKQKNKKIIVQWGCVYSIYKKRTLRQ